jgi:predicted HicB family RNase H-like nuclease
MPKQSKKPGPGRPSSGRSEYLEVRLTPEEKEAFSTIASSTGLSLSDWVRLSLRAQTNLPTIQTLDLSGGGHQGKKSTGK